VSRSQNPLPPREGAPRAARWCACPAATTPPSEEHEHIVEVLVAFRQRHLIDHQAIEKDPV